MARQMLSRRREEWDYPARFSRRSTPPAVAWWRAQPPLAKAIYGLIVVAAVIPGGTLVWLIVGAAVG